VGKSQQGKYHSWYTSSKWQKRRAHQLKIEPLCRKCTDAGRVTAARVADHIGPHNGDYNSFFTGDLQSLCFNCHDRFKRIQDLRGYDVKFGADGWPLDPNHPSNARARPRPDFE
jgi:5-methylcytosine-specific restriction endonuclease McrA